MSGCTSSTPAVRGPLIILAQLGKADFAWLDSLRKLYYPADRNKVPAHLTLFRSLPPSAESEVRRSLSRAAATAAPKARLSGVMDMDSGVALRVDSPGLAGIREELEQEFRGLLTAQDTGRWTPHVTIQNKAEPREAKKLLRQMRESVFEPRALAIAGLQLVRYSGGEWEEAAAWRFR